MRIAPLVYIEDPAEHHASIVYVKMEKVVVEVFKRITLPQINEEVDHTLKSSIVFNI